MKDKIKEIIEIKNQNKKVNTLENKVEMLENVIKDELYNRFMENIEMVNQVERLKKENKRLREKNKALRDIINGE